MVSQAVMTALKAKADERKQLAQPIEELIRNSVHQLGEAVPEHLKPERLVSIMLTAMNRNPKLYQCTPESLLGALFQCAQLGLTPNTEGQAYIIPYLNKKTLDNKTFYILEAMFQIGYKGLIELFYRHSKAVSIDVHTVREGDELQYAYGTNAFLTHIPSITRGKPLYYYAIAYLFNGGKVFKVMTHEQCIEHGKTHSKCFDPKIGDFKPDTPWATETDAMCKKTVLIQLAKVLPKSVELQKAIAMDATTKTKVALDMFQVRDETIWNEEELPCDDTAVIAG